MLFSVSTRALKLARSQVGEEVFLLGRDSAREKRQRKTKASILTDLLLNEQMSGSEAGVFENDSGFDRLFADLYTSEVESY